MAKITKTTTDVMEQLEQKETEPIQEVKPTAKPSVSKSAKTIQELATEAKAKAFKTKIVTITSNDKRDNSETNSIYVTCENQFFSKSRVVPLDIAIELEQCLIDTIREIKMVIHKPELVNGKPTRNHIPVEVRKYSIVEG